jgi:hypothetical protein
MTLARSFLLGILLTASTPYSLGVPMPQSTPANPAGTPSDSQNQTQTTPSQKPGDEQNKAKKTTPPAKAGAHKTASKKKPKTASAGCNASGPATPSASGTNTTSTPNTPAGDAAQTQAPATSNESDPCPPKVVVRQGGTSEPAIQLTGGAAGAQKSEAQATAGPMIDATEENLKKLSARQLSATEQETITQIRQFITQSKTAVAAGDMERARTLAWKAQTLSDDLVKPQQ